MDSFDPANADRTDERLLSPPRIDLVEAIDPERFAEWYTDRQFARNVREGRPYFNGPSRVSDPERQSPSQLLQCHRKILYRQENAPEETGDPEGIFWTGRRFETDVVVPYLQEAVVGEDEYVRNSMWIDATAETEAGEVRFRGTTDPVIVDDESEPLVVTEVKTKQSLDGLTAPNRHHLAQVHAYMYGLSETHDRPVRDAVIVYGDRTTMDIETFHEPFDEEFWADVLAWTGSHTEFRRDGVLPPADPAYGWECEYCAFEHRCGESDLPYADTDARGLLELFEDYPRDKVKEYLEAHEKAKLTPTLAAEYPDLAASYGVRGWRCPACEATYAWDALHRDGASRDTDDPPRDTDGPTRHSEEPGLTPPMCPDCADGGDIVDMRAEPESQ